MTTRKKRPRKEQFALAKVRSENIGRLLVLAFRRFEEIMVERMRFHGFTDIRQVHTALLRNIDIDGSRLTEIAQRAGMHKQAVGQLASEVELLGYIRRTADPTDGRASLIRFTTKGAALLKALPQIHEETEKSLAEILGPKGIAGLTELLWPIAEQQRQRELATLDASYRQAQDGEAIPELSARGKRRGRKPRNGTESAQPTAAPLARR